MINDIKTFSNLDAFRRTVRAWIIENCPKDLITTERGDRFRYWGGKKWTSENPSQTLWLERCIEQGWTVPTWPVQYGGAGLSIEQGDIIKEEMEKLNVPAPLYNYGVTMLGPTLLKFGNEAQKAMHLPAIAKGEIRWCQGYSEPNAGSDLASLSMKCEDKGDHWLINGQKIWTSTADKSDWIFTLVRTSNQADRKHKGITFVLIDLETAGITIRPIDLISGKSPFCETFFDNVVVPKNYSENNASVIGEPDDGWKIGMHLLTVERGSLGSYTLEGRGHEAPLIETAIEKFGLNDNGTLNNPILRAKIASAQVDEAGVVALAEHLNTQASDGIEIGAKSSLVKYASTKIIQKGYDLRMQISGLDGTSEAFPTCPTETTLAQNWLYSRAYTILGGTSEIQLNIITKRLLGLPSK